MQVKPFVVNPFYMNCYVYHDEVTRNGIIIDPGVSNDKEIGEIETYLNNRKILIKAIINTHGHIDHIMGNKWAKDFLNVPIYLNEKDLGLVKSAPVQAEMFGLDIPVLPAPDVFVNDSEQIEFENFKLKILETPGHSKGSITLIDELNRTMFCGDCLFRNSIGRTDLPGGDSKVLLESIKEKLFSYDDDFVVYPGHMEFTTIGEERINNPFLNGTYEI